MRYRDQNSNLKAHIATLRAVAALQALLIVALWYGGLKAREDLRVHLPPDLRSGGVVQAGNVQPPNVYAFALAIFEQLNYWEIDGAKDYGTQLYRLAAYLTPTYRADIAADIKHRGLGGELHRRTRSFHTLPGHGYGESRVKLLGNGVWVVFLDGRIREHVNGMAVKQVAVRYPVRVVLYDVNPDKNPWGLALDGFQGQGPKPLSTQALKGGPQ